MQGDNDSWEHYRQFREKAAYDPFDEYEIASRLPTRIVLDIAGYRILAQHDYSHELMETQGWTTETVRTAMMRPYVEAHVDLTGIDIALFGDIHKAFVDVRPSGLIVHPGSVGAPFDETPWDAKFVVLTLGADEVVVSSRNAPYSREQAILDVRRGFRVDPGEHFGFARLLAGGTEDHRWDPPAPEVVWRRTLG